MASKKTNPLASLNSHSPWQEKTDPIWPCSSFNLRRNIKGYLFPNKLTKAQAQKLLKALQTALLSASELQNPYYVSSESLSLEEKQTLFEHFLWKKPLRSSDLRYGFVLDDTSRFIAQLNLQDHLKLQLIDVNGMWAEAWNLLEKIEGHIQETLPLAFHSDYGYLTSAPLQSGCALEVIAYLHLPALIRSPRWTECLASLKKKRIQASGLFTLDTYPGDFVLLSNASSLSISETTLLQTLHETAFDLSLKERQQRLLIQSSKPVKFQDQMSRTLGLFNHAKQLSALEALNALSQMKLGIDLGWVEGLYDETINSLMLSVQKAHLEIPKPSIKEKTKLRSQIRAEYLQNKLKHVHLTL